MRMQPQSRTNTQWNTQERLRYYHLSPNPIDGGPTALRSTASPDGGPHQRQMMFAAHNALRGGYTYLDWKSGLTSTEPSDWWYPIEYKRCLTEWTSSHGYFLGGGGAGGGGGGGEWVVEDGYQKCPEFIPADDGRMSSSFGRDLPKSSSFKDPSSSPYDRPGPPPLGHSASSSSVVLPSIAIDGHSSYLTSSFDNDSYSSVPYSSALCLSQSDDVIHPTSALAAPLSPVNHLRRRRRHPHRPTWPHSTAMLSLRRRKAILVWSQCRVAMRWRPPPLCCRPPLDWRPSIAGSLDAPRHRHFRSTDGRSATAGNSSSSSNRRDWPFAIRT